MFRNIIYHIYHTNRRKTRALPKKKTHPVRSGYQADNICRYLIIDVQGVKKGTKFSHSFRVTRVHLAIPAVRPHNAVGCVFLLVGSTRLIPSTIPTRYAVSGPIADYFYYFFQPRTHFQPHACWTQIITFPSVIEKIIII